MKLYIINLATLGFYGSKKIDLSMTELYKLQSIIQNPENHILVNSAMEFWDSNIINAALTMLGIQPDQTNVSLLVEECKLHHPNDEPINFKNIHYYNDNLMKTANSRETFNTNINLTLNKFLFIVGKSYKRHRIGLLHKLYERGLLAKSEWSFRVSEPELTRSLLSEVNDDEYQVFISNVTKDLDIPSNEPIFRPDVCGWPTESWLYSDTSFTLLSETHCDPEYLTFITEKTWRAIANKHLFVTASYINNIEFLENLGFDTFQYALRHKKEAFTLDKSVDEIISMTVDNVEHLLSNLPTHESRIIESIENNCRALENRIDHFRGIIDVAIEPYIIKPYYYTTDTFYVIEGTAAEKAIKKLWC